MSPGRILIVDDEPDIVRPCVRALTMQGYEAQGASGGREALALVEREPFDLLLLDLKMPDMDGLEVLRQAKDMRPGVEAIIISGYGTLEIAIEAMRLGALDFMTKPIDMSALIDKIQQTLKYISPPKTGVHGDLCTMSLTSIISIVCNEGTVAAMNVESAGRTAIIFFDKGNIVHAELNKHVGADAIYQLLTWEEGNFTVTASRTAPERTIHTNWEGLLLEGLRRIDETGLDAEPFTLEGFGEFEPLPTQKERPSSFFSAFKFEKETLRELIEGAPAIAGDIAASAQDSNAPFPTDANILQGLADSLDDFVAASVIDAGGAPIASLITGQSFDAEKSVAVMSRLVDQVTEFSTTTDGGKFAETITTSKRYTFITRAIGDGEFFIQLTVTSTGNIGAARMYLENCEKSLLEALQREKSSD